MLQLLNRWQHHMQASTLKFICLTARFCSWWQWQLYRDLTSLHATGCSELFYSLYHAFTRWWWWGGGTSCPELPSTSICSASCTHHAYTCTYNPLLVGFHSQSNWCLASVNRLLLFSPYMLTTTQHKYIHSESSSIWWKPQSCSLITLYNSNF